MRANLPGKTERRIRPPSCSTLPSDAGRVRSTVLNGAHSRWTSGKVSPELEGRLYIYDITRKALRVNTTLGGYWYHFLERREERGGEPT